jgi:excisionase family DNA binding protein
MSLPFRERLTCSVKEALEASGIGRTKFYELVARGQIDTIMVGDRRLVKIQSLQELLEAERDRTDDRAAIG